MAGWLGVPQIIHLQPLELHLGFKATPPRAMRLQWYRAHVMAQWSPRSGASKEVLLGGARDAEQTKRYKNHMYQTGL